MLEAVLELVARRVRHQVLVGSDESPGAVLRMPSTGSLLLRLQDDAQRLKPGVEVGIGLSARGCHDAQASRDGRGDHVSRGARRGERCNRGGQRLDDRRHVKRSAARGRAEA